MRQTSACPSNNAAMQIHGCQLEKKHYVNLISSPGEAKGERALKDVRGQHA
jgi:hypothetical protein